MFKRSFIVLVVSCIATFGAAQAQTAANAPSGITVRKDVVYGTGLIDAANGGHTRGLLMDVYAPAETEDGTAKRPAILMAFGGSFHRGDKGEGRFQEDGAQDSSMADYCRAFARRGYLCFSMEYRMTPEDPALSAPIEAAKLMTPSLVITPETTARIDFARQKMGLAALDAAGRDQFWRALLSASEDMNAAIAYIRTQSDAFGIDPERLAIGGFSAGAITAINTAYGADAPVKAVVALSGTSWGYDLTTTAKPGQPPLLMFVGQNDLPGVRYGSGQIAALFSRAGIPYQAVWVAGFGHFYPMGAVSLGADLTKSPVSERILTFLDSELKAAP